MLYFSHFNILKNSKETVLLMSVCDHWVQSSVPFVMLTNLMDSSGPTFFVKLFLGFPTFSGRPSWDIFIHLPPTWVWWDLISEPVQVLWEFKASTFIPISISKSLVPCIDRTGSRRAMFSCVHLVLLRIVLGSKSWMAWASFFFSPELASKYKKKSFSWIICLF